LARKSAVKEDYYYPKALKMQNNFGVAFLT